MSNEIAKESPPSTTGTTKLAAVLGPVSEATAPPNKAEIKNESQPETRREFLAAHPPPGEPEGFIDTDEVCKRLQVSRGTIANWRKHGLPHVITPGARSVRFFWPSVRDYLLRQQRNAA